MRYSYNRGFTIVELLIVVVVIAILAAITIVSFNGIQARAARLQVFQAANETAKLLTAYHAVNGTYPAFSADVCLSGYTSNNLCASTSGETPARDLSFEAALRSVGNLPDFPAGNTGGAYTGLMFTREAGRTLKGSLAEYSIKFFLSGQGRKCEVRNSVRWTGTVYEYADADSTWSTTTQCKIILPQPQ